MLGKKNAVAEEQKEESFKQIQTKEHRPCPSEGLGRKQTSAVSESGPGSTCPRRSSGGSARGMRTRGRRAHLPGGPGGRGLGRALGSGGGAFPIFVCAGARRGDWSPLNRKQSAALGLSAGRDSSSSGYRMVGGGGKRRPGVEGPQVPRGGPRTAAGPRAARRVCPQPERRAAPRVPASPGGGPGAGYSPRFPRGRVGAVRGPHPGGGLTQPGPPTPRSPSPLVRPAPPSVERVADGPEGGRPRRRETRRRGGRAQRRARPRGGRGGDGGALTTEGRRLRLSCDLTRPVTTAGAAGSQAGKK